MRTGDAGASSTMPGQKQEQNTREATDGQSQGSRLLSHIEAMGDAADKADDPIHKAEMATVEAFSRTLVSATNVRQFDHPIFELTSPNLRDGFEDCFGPTMTKAAHREIFLQIAAERPEYHIEIVDISIDLEPGGEVVRAYMANRVTGRPPGFIKDAVGVFTWHRHGNPEGW